MQHSRPWLDSPETKLKQTVLLVKVLDISSHLTCAMVTLQSLGPARNA